MTSVPPKPQTHNGNLAELPCAIRHLKDHPAWCLWKWEHRGGRGHQGNRMGATDREGRWTKPPRQPSGDLAESNNPATWSTYDAVLAAVERFDGIGIMVRDL